MTLVSGCKSKSQPASVEGSAASATSARATSTPGEIPNDAVGNADRAIGARIAASGGVPAFELALSARSGDPESFLPHVIEVVAKVLRECNGVLGKMSSVPAITVSLDVMDGKVVPGSVQSPSLSGADLECARDRLLALALPAGIAKSGLLIQFRLLGESAPHAEPRGSQGARSAAPVAAQQ